MSSDNDVLVSACLALFDRPQAASTNAVLQHFMHRLHQLQSSNSESGGNKQTSGDERPIPARVSAQIALVSLIESCPTALDTSINSILDSLLHLKDGQIEELKKLGVPIASWDDFSSELRNLVEQLLVEKNANEDANSNNAWKRLAKLLPEARDKARKQFHATIAEARLNSLRALVALLRDDENRDKEVEIKEIPSRASPKQHYQQQTTMMISVFEKYHHMLVLFPLMFGLVAALEKQHAILRSLSPRRSAPIQRLFGGIFSGSNSNSSNNSHNTSKSSSPSTSSSSSKAASLVSSPVINPASLPVTPSETASPSSSFSSSTSSSSSLSVVVWTFSSSLLTQTEGCEYAMDVMRLLAGLGFLPPRWVHSDEQQGSNSSGNSGSDDDLLEWRYSECKILEEVAHYESTLRKCLATHAKRIKVAPSGTLREMQIVQSQKYKTENIIEHTRPLSPSARARSTDNPLGISATDAGLSSLLQENEHEKFQERVNQARQQDGKLNRSVGL